MKRGLIVVLLLAVTLIAAGCSKDKGADVQVNNNQNLQGRGQFNQTPEGKLRRAVMEIQQLERSDNKITKEQAQKLIQIINEIKAKESIDQAYSDKKSEEIRAIFTDVQKKFLDERRNGQGPRNNGQNGQGRQQKPDDNGQGGPQQNDNKNNRNWQPPQNGGGNGPRQGDGQRGGFQPGNMKSFYDQIIKTLEEKVK